MNKTKLNRVLLKSTIIRYIENKLNIHIFSDKTFLQAQYYIVFKKKINWSNPKTFNEKLQWLKINDRNPLYVKLVDKYEVKAYIGDKIGLRYIIPTYGIWNKYEEINFDILPNSFVLKCTHDSGGLFICKDKRTLNYDECKKKFSHLLKKNFFYVGREWPYKNIKPRILAEAYIQDQIDDANLTDYKIHCFNGDPKIILVCQNRFQKDGLRESFFDKYWNLLSVKRPKIQQCSPAPQKPLLLDEMLYISKKLSSGIPFVRIDLYESNNRLFFGEMTFYPASGLVPFEPQDYDVIMGQWLALGDVSN